MSYGLQWLLRAASETRQYWTLPQIATTIAAPIVGALTWRLFKPWIGWWPVMQIAVISGLGFCALWGIGFFVVLIATPGKIDADKNALLALKEASISKLQLALTAKHPHDESLENRVRDTIQMLSERERGFVEWLLTNGPIRNTHIQKAGYSREPLEILEKTSSTHLIKYERELANGIEMDRTCQINPTLVNALKNVLHPPPPRWT